MTTVLAAALGMSTVSRPALSAEDFGTVERLSVGNTRAGSPLASGDGRYVVFLADDSGAVPGDAGTRDLFLRDRATDVTTMLTGDVGGLYGVESPRISADGRFVAFVASLASDQRSGIYLHDVEAGTTERVSVTTSGTAAEGRSPTISGDGRYVAFTSSQALVPRDTNRKYDTDIYVHDRVRNVNRLVSVSSKGVVSDGHSEVPVISTSGRYVAFASYASNLVPRDTGTWDVFVRDLEERTTTKVSVDMDGRRSNSASRDPSISASGRYIAFTSSSSDLVTSDTNGEQEVFVRDMARGVTERVAVSSMGRQAHNDSVGGTISGGGRYVAFSSWAGNLVHGDTNGTWDAFLHDRRTGSTRRVSVSSTGEQGNGRSYASWVSPGGRYAAFMSEATNLVPADGHEPTYGAFLWDRGRR